MSQPTPPHQPAAGLPNPSPHSFKNRLMRLVWGIVQATLFRFSPKPMLRWRVFLLKLFGAKVTYKSRIYPKAKIWGPWNLVMGDYATLADDVDCYCVDTITIGESTTISQYTYLCGATHEFEDIKNTLVPLPITIGSRVWIAADCFISPDEESALMASFEADDECWVRVRGRRYVLRISARRRVALSCLIARSLAHRRRRIGDKLLSLLYISALPSME